MSLFQRIQQLAESIHGRLEVFQDVLRQFLRGRQVVQISQSLVLDPEDIQAGFVPIEDLLGGKPPPAAIRVVLAPGLVALIAVFRVVALDEVFQILIGHWVLFQGKVQIGPQIVEPDFLGLPLRAGGALIKEDYICLDAGLVEDSGGQSENGVEVAGLQQLLPDSLPGSALKEHIVRHHHRRLSGGFQKGVDVLEEVELLVGAGGPEILPVVD